MWDFENKYVIACTNNRGGSDRYYFTGNYGDGYPPKWTWRKELALTVEYKDTSQSFLNMLKASGITINDGDLLAEMEVEKFRKSLPDVSGRRE